MPRVEPGVSLLTRRGFRAVRLARAGHVPGTGRARARRCGWGDGSCSLRAGLAEAKDRGMSNSSISGYSVTEILFESTRSIIYRATRDGDGRPVVIKVLNAEYPTLEQIGRLRREYRMTREANAEGVIEVVALERYRSSLAIVLEDFGGASLAQLTPAEPLELRRVLAIGARLAGTLGRVHQRRIIHKDINPSNIVYNARSDVVKLIDFGIATELSREAAAHVGPGRLEGTLPYMSPEQTGRMNRTIDYRTDFYSLGVTLYQLATGRLPFTGADALELVHCHIAQ